MSLLSNSRQPNWGICGAPFHHKICTKYHYIFMVCRDTDQIHRIHETLQFNNNPIRSSENRWARTPIGESNWIRCNVKHADLCIFMNTDSKLLSVRARLKANPLGLSEGQKCLCVVVIIIFHLKFFFHYLMSEISTPVRQLECF